MDFSFEALEAIRARQKLAWDAVGRAVRSGRLVPPKACTRCGAKGPVQAHHPRYDRPLEVQWICSRCQAELHQAARRSAGRKRRKAA